MMVGGHPVSVKTRTCREGLVTTPGVYSVKGMASQSLLGGTAPARPRRESKRAKRAERFGAGATSSCPVGDPGQRVALFGEGV